MQIAIADKPMDEPHKVEITTTLLFNSSTAFLGSKGTVGRNLEVEKPTVGWVH